MNRPKRHHFVPQMLLRRFTDESGRLRVFDKRFPERGILYCNPANVFVQCDFYTQHGDDGNKDVSVEKMLADLEGLADAIIEKTISAARKRNAPNLTDSEKEVWDHFLYYQWKRVPDVHEITWNHAEVEEYFEDWLERYETTIRPLTAEERDSMKDPDVRARIWQDGKVRAVAVPGREPLKALADKGLLVALIPRPNKSFIIGSHPVVKLTYPGHSHLADPSVEVWLPIAHDVAVTPGFSRGTEKLIEIKDVSHIRHINEAMFKQSTAIAGRSRALIASLAGVR